MRVPFGAGYRPLPARDFKVPNASINRLVRDGARWRIDCWGDVAHLRQLVALDELDG